MPKLVLTGLIAAAVAGLVGFGVGKRSTTRIESRPAPPAASQPAPASKPETSAPAAVPVSSAEASEPSTASPKIVAPPAEKVPARRRLIDLLIGNMADDKLFYAVRNAAMSDPALQKKVFDELMTTQDPEMIALAKESLYGIQDASLVQQILDAYSMESWSERKAALAHVIGTNLHSPAARSVFESILMGTDPMLLENALARTSVQAADRYGELAAKMTSRLRELVAGDGSSGLRVAAARALRGDRSQEGVAFLIDRMMNDSDPDVQMQAMVALPITYSSGGYDVATQVRPLLAVAFDEKRPERMRRWAADRALMGSHMTKDLITDEQRENLKKLAGKQ